MSDDHLSRLSLNQETIKQWSLPELTEGCVKAGVGMVGLWRAPVQEYGVERTARLLADAGLTVTSLCRGGFFTALDPAERARALDDNRAAIDEAAALSTDTLVLVSGGLPPGSRDLYGARERVADALAELAPYAATRGVRLAIEPLHPMYASDRCVVSTLGQALDLAERFLPTRSGWSSTPTTSGGTTGRPPRSPARVRAAASTPSSWPTGSPRSRRASCWVGANWATAAWTSVSSAVSWKPPASTARSRWRSSTRRCGPATGRRPWRKWRSAMCNMPAESPRTTLMAKRS